MVIGVISDTHGRLDAAVKGIFAGVAHIIHAGDVGDARLLDELAEIAPVTAVFGNTDQGELRERLPRVAVGEVTGATAESAAGPPAAVRFAVAHKRKQLLAAYPDPAVQGLRLMVYGHTHEPALSWRQGVLFVNSGTVSAPEESDWVRSVALVECGTGPLTARVVFLM
jgi:putative phosphoesterase